MTIESQLVPPGYKQTEVGVIPEDWEVAPIGSLGLFSKGQGIRKDEASSGEIPCVRYGEIYTHHNDRVRHFNSFISSDVAKTSKRLKTGDLLFAGSGETKEEIGKCVAFLEEVEAYAGGDIVILSPTKGVPAYFGYLFNAPAVVRQKASKGQGDAVVHISATALSSIQIPLPLNNNEQAAIAEALSDADALIDSLERLIVKKRQLKQGAMQELLTGKVRLPEFGGEWAVKSFGELFNFSGGLSASREQLSSEGHCYLHYGDIHGANKTYIDVRAEFSDIPKLNVPLGKVSPSSLLADGDVVFVDASEDDEGTSKHVVVVNPEGIPFISGLHTIVAKSKTDELVHAYRRFCFQTAEVKAQFRFFAVGTKVSGISKTNIAKIELSFPSVPEQTAIAAVLSDMDTEIAALDARLAKARNLKQGMMQELLTGRVRLVD